MRAAACADTLPAPSATRRGPARTATGRSSRATPASPHRAGTRAAADCAICCGDHARLKPRLHHRPQLRRRCQLRLLRSPRPDRRLPIGPHRPIPMPATVCRHLPRHRRRRPPEPRRDPPQRRAATEPARDLLALLQRQASRRPRPLPERQPALRSRHPLHRLARTPHPPSRLQHPDAVRQQPPDLPPRRPRQRPPRLTQLPHHHSSRRHQPSNTMMRRPMETTRSYGVRPQHGTRAEGAQIARPAGSGGVRYGFVRVRARVTVVRWRR